MNGQPSNPFRKRAEDLRKQSVRSYLDRVDDETVFSSPFLVVLKSDIGPQNSEFLFNTELGNPATVKEVEDVAAGSLLDPEAMVLPIISRKNIDSAYAMITIGRAANCDIVIPSKVVSKFHAYFSPDLKSPGSYRVADGGSRNGTFLNSKLLLKDDPQPVASGDRIDLGTCWAFRIYLPADFRALVKKIRR